MKDTDIIVCDSGISKRHLGKVYVIDNKNEFMDKNGHGSQIIDILKLMNNEFKLSCLRVLDENRKCTLQNLLDNLTKCLEINAKIILLALSVENNLINKELHDIIRQLYLQGKVIVSAGFNRCEISIPAAYKEVIGVKIGQLENNLLYYNGKRKVQSIIPVEQIISESIDGVYSSFSGNSFASTLFAGHICNIINTKGINDRMVLDKFLENETYDKISYKNLIQIDIKTSYSCERKKEIKKVLLEVLKKLHISCQNNNLLEEIKNIKQLSIFIGELINKNLSINRKSLLLVRYLMNVDILVDYLYSQE